MAEATLTSILVKFGQEIVHFGFIFKKSGNLSSTSSKSLEILSSFPKNLEILELFPQKLGTFVSIS